MTTFTATAELEGIAGTAAITILDPRNGSLVGTLPVAGEQEIAAALARARSAAGLWSRVDPAQRGLALGRMAEALRRHVAELAELNSRETGKPTDEARGGIEAAIGTLRQYAELGPLHRTHSLRGPDTAIDYTRPEPRGVVVAVTPWNDPVAVAAGLLGAAIVTGNSVVHKPSERCPHLGLRLGQVLEAELPPGVLTTVTGNAVVGARLVAIRPSTSSPTSAPRPRGARSPPQPPLPAPTYSARTEATTPCWSTPTWTPPGPPSRPRSARSPTSDRSAPPWSGSSCTGTWPRNS